ncbi:hypothetical protein [Roseateles paludis]|uniref:Uncharacterized protein n=1 Tax=Roseateles paludis TaxID=3145238 RepID=A0ABV0FW35_9BURK
MLATESLLRRLVDDAGQQPLLFLPKLEPHPMGAAVGLGGVALGLYAARQSAATLLGWFALTLCVAGMFIHATLRRQGIGWQLDLQSRTLRPVGQPGEAQVLDAEGWSLFCVGGSGRRMLALEFRHQDGGAPRRFFQTRSGANRTEHQLTSQLADALAARLQMGRQGLSL